MASPLGWLRRATAIALLTVAVCLVGLAESTAHPPNDNLKVPVGRVATVPLPSVPVVAGPTQIQISASPGFRIINAAAGGGWGSRVAANRAVLVGRATSGEAFIGLTGIAHQVGTYEIDVWVLSAGERRQHFGWTLTALGGNYSRQTSVAGLKPAPPDAPVAIVAKPTTAGRAWLVSLILALAALAVLVIRPRRH